MKKTISNLLNNNGLRQTSTRLEILRLYLERGYALSHKDIEDSLSDTFDRVTIYRTLRSFEEKGIIHRVYDDSQVAKYALCGDTCHNHQHDDNHVHFSCTHCKRTFCLENIEVPTLQLSSDYKVTGVHLFVTGLCRECQSDPT